MKTMTDSHEVTVNILAEIKAADVGITRTSALWRAAQNRYLTTVDRDVPGLDIETAWIEASAAYEAALDAIREKGRCVKIMHRMGLTKKRRYS